MFNKKDYSFLVIIFYLNLIKYYYNIEFIIYLSSAEIRKCLFNQ